MLCLEEPLANTPENEKTVPASVAAAADRARAEAAQQAAERRAAARLPKAMLPWLEVARLKYGATVGVVDLSTGGALIESSAPLKPGAVHSLEISGASKPVVARFGVLRSKIASLTPEKVVYRTACAFTEPLDLPELHVDLTPAPPPAPASEETAASADAPPMDAAPAGEDVDMAPQKDAPMIEGWQRAVARFVDGRMVKGFTNDFAVTRPQFTVRTTTDDSAPGSVLTIADLKAVFFVRDFDGNPAHRERKTFGPACLGKRIEVRFSDGEMLVGTTPGYRPNGPGFFMTPADPRANNCRVFVVSSAVRNVRFL